MGPSRIRFFSTYIESEYGAGFKLPDITVDDGRSYLRHLMERNTVYRGYPFHNKKEDKLKIQYIHGLGRACAPSPLGLTMKVIRRKMLCVGINGRRIMTCPPKSGPVRMRESVKNEAGKALKGGRTITNKIPPLDFLSQCYNSFMLASTNKDSLSRWPLQTEPQPRSRKMHPVVIHNVEKSNICIIEKSQRVTTQA